MSVINKNDLKNQLAPNRGKNLHAIHLVAKQPVVVSSVIDPTTSHANDFGFTGDFSLEHSAPGGAITAVVIATAEDVEVSQAPASQSTKEVSKLV